MLSYWEWKRQEEADPEVLVWRVDPVTKYRHTALVRRSEAEREKLERVRW